MPQFPKLPYSGKVGKVEYLLLGASDARSPNLGQSEGLSEWGNEGGAGSETLTRAHTQLQGRQHNPLVQSPFLNHCFLPSFPEKPLTFYLPPQHSQTSDVLRGTATSPTRFSATNTTTVSTTFQRTGCAQMALSSTPSAERGSLAIITSTLTAATG